MDPNIPVQPPQPIISEVQIPAPQLEIIKVPGSSGNKIKYILIALVILIIIVISGGTYILNKNSVKQVLPTPTPMVTVNPTPTPDTTANWKTETDDANGFTYSYPADWTVLTVGTMKNADKTLQQYVTDTEANLSKPGLSSPVLLNPDNESKRKPVSEHTIISHVFYNKILGNVMVAYILKDLISVITIQGFPTIHDKNSNYTNEQTAIFNKIISTVKFSN